ncbi:MAG: type IV pilus assembly protein PilN [Candidatus Endobugula sp.]|jgi:type IV pilus assembly protein PilN
MATINLLPWRDEYRQEKKREFFSSLVLCVILSAVVSYVMYSIVQGRVDNQLSRNNMLSLEISALNDRVKEIAELKSERRALEAKTEVIQGLQYKRPLVVHYIDKLVRTVPDGLHFESVLRKKGVLSIKGISESNTRVSSLMRSLDESTFFDAPNLINVVKNSFELTVNTVIPDDFSNLVSE